jgi:predicted nucleic acid-binding protein
MRRPAKADLLDTGVLLRFLLADDPEQSPGARAYVERLEARTERAELTDGVIAELVRDLERGFKVPRPEIVRHVASLAALPGVLYSKRTLLGALGAHRSTRCDIVDCLLAAQARARNSKVTSFDRNFEALGSAWKAP